MNGPKLQNIINHLSKPPLHPDVNKAVAALSELWEERDNARQQAFWNWMASPRDGRSTAQLSDTPRTNP